MCHRDARSIKEVILLPGAWLASGRGIKTLSQGRAFNAGSLISCGRSSVLHRQAHTSLQGQRCLCINQAWKTCSIDKMHCCKSPLQACWQMQLISLA